MNCPVNTASNALSDPTPACTPLPCAMTDPLKLAVASVVTSVKGRAFVLTILQARLLTVPVGGLKRIVGKYCENTGVAVGSTSNVPVLLGLGKKRPKMVLVETFGEGTSQLTVAVLEVAPP